MTREERVRIYTYRANNNLDLYTGEPLPEPNTEPHFLSTRWCCLHCGSTEQKKTKIIEENMRLTRHWRTVSGNLSSDPFLGRECPECSAAWDQYHGDVQAQFQSLTGVVR